jgi:hypothetical protein
MNDSVVAIVSAFFLIGIVVGIITVVAISVLRAGPPARPDELTGPEGPPPDAGRDDAGSCGRPYWPGDVDNDFSAR